MLFEFSVAKNYLFPRRGHFSASLISLVAIGVVSLIVWLILVFLSVTDGIEKSWIHKLISFNAPIQIAPTDAYYRSYYYQVDSISSQSDFSYKSIGEKAISLFTDPYNPKEDVAIPDHWPPKETETNGAAKDLVKKALMLIRNQKPHLTAQPYEVSGALLKIYMTHPRHSLFGVQEACTQNCLNQTLYVASFSDENPHFRDLIETPRMEDVNHLFDLIRCFPTSDPFSEQVRPLLENMTIKKIKNVGKDMTCLAPLLPMGEVFRVLAHQKNGQIVALTFSRGTKVGHFEAGTLKREHAKLIFTSSEGKETELSLRTPLFSEEYVSMEACIKPYDLTEIEKLSDLRFDVSFLVQKRKIMGTIPWEGIEIEEAERCIFFESPPTVPPPWIYFVKNVAVLPKGHHRATSVVLPKKFQTKQVRIGEQGHLTYYGSASGAVQEHQLPIQVAGFYDPGVIPISDLMILTEKEVVHTLNATFQNDLLDQNSMNGIQVWCSDLKQTKDVHAKLTEVFDQAGILPYWNITPYHDYDCARDLFQQFQSDKYLFTCIGIIILAVACSNIISLLMILVNDKKKEIAILSAMGTSKQSIACIFTLCGGIVGCLSTLIGVWAAFITMHNIDHVVRFLSFLQGQEVFNSLFYGTSLPNQLSDRALVFTLIATPVISLIAGFIPAIKACKIHPSKMLRSS